MTTASEKDRSQDVLVYGRDWCEDTQAMRQQLQRLGVPYRYINTDQDLRAAEWVKEQSGGKQRTPTVTVRGRVLVEPVEAELQRVLRDCGLMT